MCFPTTKRFLPKTPAEYSQMMLDAYLISKEPYYRPIGNEIELFEAAYAARMPMMLKGPTGCGKTRFIEYMAWQLGRPLDHHILP